MSVSENLFQAVDTIISQRINEVSFDRTLICEIVSDSQHEKGEYTVKQDARKFVAYASGTERYRVGQQVYVTIPQGNYDLKKIIIGRYSADDINPYQYASPMDAMLVMEVFDQFEDSFDSLKVAPSSVDKTFAEDSLITLEDSIIPPPANQEQEFGKLHYFGFEGVFTTTLESIEGNYGITIHFNENEQPDLVFDSSEFFGNPYWFEGGFKVQKIFDYDLSNVTSVKVKLYQSGNFNNLAEGDKITLSDVKLYFGYDQKEFAAAVSESEKVFTIVEEKLVKQEYYGGQSNDIKISAIYITKQGERYVREEIPAGVTWYRFYNGSENFGAGNGWAKILNQTTGTLTNDQVWTIQLKQGDEEASTTTEFPEVLNRTERICAMYEGTLSNVLEYTLAASQTSGSEQAGAGNPNLPSITVGLINDEYNGIYNLYGNDNKLIPRTLVARTLEASYDNKVPWGQNGETVMWEFPAIGSMIKAPDLGTLNGYDEMGNPKALPWSIEVVTNEEDLPSKYLVTWTGDPGAQDSRKINFKLADSYLPNYTNNTIKCITTTGQTKQWGEKQLLFGLANTAGSGYAFNINLDKQILVPDGKIVASVTLQDSTGRYITDKINPTSVVWSWNQRGQDANTLTGFQIKPKLPTGVELKEEEAQGKSSAIEANINGSLYEVGRTIYTVFSTGDNGIAKVEEWKDMYTQPEGLPIDDWNNYIQSVNADYRKICYCKEIEIYGKVEDGNQLIDLSTYRNMNILQAELNWSTEGINNNINLTSYVTIPCTTGETDVLMAGATRVVYATSGLESSYSKDPYQLLVGEEVLLPTGNTLLGRRGAEIKNLPKLISSPDQDSVLRILQPIQPKPTNPEPCYIEFRDSDNHIWQYPILITQNTYASDLLNAWGGSLRIDTEGNSILSALMGAGTKDDQNQFTGVLMGTIGNTIQGAKSGLYGLKDGARVFELNENGEFYVGTGDNYLSFDGTNFNIKVKNFYLESQNLKINPTDGIKLTNGSNIVAQLYPSGAAKIGGFNILSDKLYRRADDYGTGIAATGAGGTVAFWAGYSGAGETPWNDVSNYASKTNFYVKNNGAMYAKEAHISGNSIIEGILIAKEGGNIGGWTIGNGELYSGNTADKYTAVQSATSGTYAFVAGAPSTENYANAKFWVKHTGELKATSATITGTIKAGSMLLASEDFSKTGTRTQLGDLELATLTFTVTIGNFKGVTYTVSGLLSKEYRENSNDNTIRERLLIGGNGFYTFSGTEITIDENGKVTVNGDGAAIRKLSFTNLKL